MSRHEITALDPKRYRVFVGWDHPMMTFFGQVYDMTRRADANPILWVGTSLREIYEIEDLAKRISKYAGLAPNVRAMLYGDKDDGRMG